VIPPESCLVSTALLQNILILFNLAFDLFLAETDIHLTDPIKTHYEQELKRDVSLSHWLQVL
jgi:hypothetical protein